MLKINFVGNFGTGYVGEVADEVVLSRELKNLGHEVVEVPRDQWRSICDGEKANDDWVFPKEADINLVAKWDGFNDERYVYILRDRSKAPVVYWTWDWMEWPNTHDWHLNMCKACDLHLTNDLGIYEKRPITLHDVNWQYFPFDVADGELPIFESYDKKYDVVFFGSCIDQGERKHYLPEIAKHFNLKVFGWNHQGWQGLDAEPPVYGKDFNEKVAQSKICLQFSTNDHIWGYWSNRVGKVLTAGGFLLAKYTPGMELFLRDGADYFSSLDEAIEKIGFYLKNVPSRIEIQKRGREIGKLFTVEQRVKELSILLERFLYER